MRRSSLAPAILWQRVGAPSRPGQHSFWATLVIVEGDYRPIAADDVVAVVTEEKLVCRITRTAFQLTIHFRDVQRMLGVQKMGHLELHVAGSNPGQARMYLFAMYEPDLCRELYRIIFYLLARSAREASTLLPQEDAVSVGTAWRAQVGQRSFFPSEALAATGFDEVPLGGGSGVAPVGETGAPNGSAVLVNGPSHPQRQQQGEAQPSPRAPRRQGQRTVPQAVAEPVKPVKIHHATAPVEWRTDLLQRRARGQQSQPIHSKQGNGEDDGEGGQIPSTDHCMQCHLRLARLEQLMDEALADDNLLRTRQHASIAAPLQLTYGPVSQV